MRQTVSFVLDERVEESVEGPDAEGLGFEEDAEGGEGFSGEAVGADKGGERGLRIFRSEGTRLNSSHSSPSRMPSSA